MNFFKLLKKIFLKLISRRKLKLIGLSNSPKLLILMNQNIGDMIVCSPILREIKMTYPDSNLQVLASNNNKDIAIANPYIDKVHVYHNQWQKLFPLLIKLRTYKFDCAIELEAKIITRVILMLKIINPHCIAAVSKKEGRYGMNPQDILPYDYYTASHLEHQRDTCLDILRVLNIPVVSKKYDLFYFKENQKKSLSFISNFDSNKIIIGLNLSGSSPKRSISDKDVTKILLGFRSISKNIIIILIHKPKDRKLVSRFITEEKSSFVSLSYPTNSVLDVAALVDAVDLLITPDTSLVHMACALEKPLISIYSNDLNSFETWHPKSKSNHVIFSENFDNLKSLDIATILNKSTELIRLHVKKYL
jgi:ADP-heptose:LPS heptosyltransferase